LLFKEENFIAARSTNPGSDEKFVAKPWWEVVTRPAARPSCNAAAGGIVAAEMGFMESAIEDAWKYMTFESDGILCGQAPNPIAELVLIRSSAGEEDDP
jgi:hypothetical protein